MLTTLAYNKPKMDTIWTPETKSETEEENKVSHNSLKDKA